MHKNPMILVMAAGLALAGCAHLNTGQVDYRVVDSSAKPAGAANCSGCVTMGNRYRISGGDEQPFKDKDIFSMEIEQMVIGNNVTEGRVLGRNFDKKGEFAILANVFEFAAAATDAPSRRFLQSNEMSREPGNTSDVEMKLIFYGDDIRAKQALNFSNIPLHQRSRYNGGSIGVQLAVLEVDTGSEPMAKLLTTLAKFGQQAVPVASEVSDVLFDLGESLFTGGKGDDRLFEYRFVLSAESDELDSTQALFTPGRYVLRRIEDRTVGDNWATVLLDPATGRLVYQDGTERRDEMYLVVNVRRYPEGTTPEHYNFERWSTVREALSKADPVTTPLTELKTTLDAALTKERSVEWRNILFNRWSLAESALRALQARHVPKLDVAPLKQCPAPQTKAADRAGDLAELRARDALRDYLAQYQNAMKAPAVGAGVELSTSDQQQLVSRVAQYFLPWEDDVMQKHFANPANLATLLNSGSFADIAVKTAIGRARELNSCEELPQVN